MFGSRRTGANGSSKNEKTPVTNGHGAPDADDKGGGVRTHDGSEGNGAVGDDVQDKANGESEVRVTPTPARTAYVIQPRRPDFRLPGGGGDGRKFVVGKEISLSGEIKSCERLVVEGKVEVTTDACQTLEIVEGGLYKGKAIVKFAEIDGVFEGELVVEQRLQVRGNGVVKGTIRYGELTVEKGGRLYGDIAATSENGFSFGAARTQDIGR